MGLTLANPFTQNKKASTSQAGVVQLSSEINSNSEDLAATPKAVKDAINSIVYVDTSPPDNTDLLWKKI